MNDHSAIEKDEGVPQHPSSEELAQLRLRVAETYTRGAEVLEQTAELADQFAAQKARDGRHDDAAHERAEAASAREVAAQLSARAQQLRRVSRQPGGSGGA